MKKAEIYDKALKYWGEDAQIVMAIEEMSELIKALCKLNRNFNGGTTKEVKEEIVDVVIMLEQLKVMFGFSDEEFSTIAEKKLKRLHYLVVKEVNDDKYKVK